MYDSSGAAAILFAIVRHFGLENQIFVACSSGIVAKHLTAHHSTLHTYNEFLRVVLHRLFGYYSLHFELDSDLWN